MIISPARALGFRPTSTRRSPPASCARPSTRFMTRSGADPHPEFVRPRRRTPDPRPRAARTSHADDERDAVVGAGDRDARFDTVARTPSPRTKRRSRRHPAVRDDVAAMFQTTSSQHPRRGVSPATPRPRDGRIRVPTSTRCSRVRARRSASSASFTPTSTSRMSLPYAGVSSWDASGNVEGIYAALLRFRACRATFRPALADLVGSEPGSSRLASRKRTERLRSSILWRRRPCAAPSWRARSSWRVSRSFAHRLSA